MKLTEKLASLTDTAAAEARANVEKAEKEAENKKQIAEAFDAQSKGETILPHLVITRTGSYSLPNLGTLLFRDVTPEQLLDLMNAFPRVEAGLLRSDRGTSYRQRVQVDEKEIGKFFPGDGYNIDINKTADYPVAVKVEWGTVVNGVAFELSATMLEMFDVLPRINARVERYGGDGPIRRVSDASLRWPVVPAAKRGSYMEGTNGLVEVIRYSQACADHFPNFLVWAKRQEDGSSPIRATVEAWAAHCYEKKRNSRRAYLEAKAAGMEPEPATVYQAERLRTGTEAQHDCLNTEQARKDAALARAHWLAYVEDSNPTTWPSEPRQKYFDHYAWACHWLFLHGLYVDPNAEGYPNGYKYGSAWL